MWLISWIQNAFGAAHRLNTCSEQSRAKRAQGDTAPPISWRRQRYMCPDGSNRERLMNMKNELEPL